MRKSANSGQSTRGGAPRRPRRATPPPEPAPELPEETDLVRELAERHLADFIREAWPIVVPQDPYVHGWHIDAIAEHLEAVTLGQIQSLIINVPPRHTKSTITGVMWPCWTWTRRPASRWIFSSYAQSLSTRDSLACRRLITSPWYQSLWGSRFVLKEDKPWVETFDLADDQNLKMRFDNDKGGYRIATSVGGAVTGEGGDFLVADDPHNAKEGESDTIRQTTCDWFDLSWSTRVTDPKKSAFVVIMQRLHEGDVTGHLLAKKSGWQHLCLPAKYDKPRSTVSTGWKDPRTKPGELLWPARFGNAEIAKLEKDLGTYGASGQLQQEPTPSEGGTFQRASFSIRWRPHESPTRIYCGHQILELKHFRRFSTVDLATSLKQTADYTVVATWGLWPSNPPVLFLFDLYRDRIPAAGTILEATLRDHARRHRTMWAGVESKGFQLAIVQQLVAKGLRVKPVEMPGDKMQHAQAATPMAEQRRIVLPEFAPWLADFEKELFLFPNADHDDQVDTLSMAAQMIPLANIPIEKKLRAHDRRRRRAGEDDRDQASSVLKDAMPREGP